MGRVFSFTSGSFTLGQRSPNPLVRYSVYCRAGRGDQKNKILFPNGNPSLLLSSPVTDTTVISSLTAASLFFFPSRKDGRKDRCDEKMIKKT